MLLMYKPRKNGKNLNIEIFLGGLNENRKYEKYGCT